MKYYNNNPPTLYVSSIIGHSLPAVTVCPSMVTTNVKILEGAYNYFGNYKGNGCKYSGNHGVSPFNGSKYTGNHGPVTDCRHGTYHGGGTFNGYKQHCLEVQWNSWREPFKGDKYAGNHGDPGALQ